MRHYRTSFGLKPFFTAAYVRNRFPTTALKENETLYKRDMEGNQMWATYVYLGVLPLPAYQTDSRFVGYSLTLKGYRLFDEKNQKMYIRRDVEFNENDFGQK